MSKNAELANLLFEFADVLEMKGVDWKPKAYRRAARSVESLSEPIESLYKKGGKKALLDLPGVGEHIALKIEEFLKTGKIKEYESEKKGLPKNIESLLHVRGLGPKKVMLLYKKKGIGSVKDLQKAAKGGKLRSLAGFGEKSEKEILRNLEILKEGQERRLLGFTLPIAKDIQNALKKSGASVVELAGSLRRMRETVGDIDILVIDDNPKKIMRAFTSLPDVKRVLEKGETRSSVILENGVQADVRVLNKESFGASWMYFTGSKEHNVALRELAIKKGFKLSEYGLFKKNRFVAGKSEKEVYQKLSLDWIPPELRENQGEIDAAKKGTLPNLVNLGDIKGDLHVHSVWSDGTNSIEEMAIAAKKLGYEYMAMTDHSKSQKIANGMDVKRLRKYFEEIKRVEKKVGIRIFKSSEVDILSNGSLDYDDDILKEMDIVIAAIHSGFKSSSEEMTKRILRAFENPYVNVFVHPTGRLIGERDPYSFDFENVAKAAAKKGIALEVDSYPSRLDLKDKLIRDAIGFGCKISISTDSHAVPHLKFMELGVAQARRGWAQKKDIINTLSLRDFERFLRR
jgi:DNA polymerase (family 10)